METAKATEIKPETETVEIKHWSGRVLFSAAIDVSVPKWGRLKAAVELGVANGARLDGARLDGASLDGARLAGARLDGASLDGASLVGARLVGAKIKAVIARTTRSDGYEFIAWRTTEGGITITAGCRTMPGTDAYREHVKSYSRRKNGTALAAETLAILDFIDVRAKETP